MPNAKPVPVPVQYLYDVAAAVTKYKQVAAEGIKIKMALYYNTQSIDRLPHIRDSKGKVYLYAGIKMDHHCLSNVPINLNRVSDENPSPISIRYRSPMITFRGAVSFIEKGDRIGLGNT